MITNTIFYKLRDKSISEFNDKLDSLYKDYPDEYNYCQDDNFKGLTNILYLNIHNITVDIIKNNFKDKNMTEEVSSGISNGLNASLSSLRNIGLLLDKSNIDQYIKNYFEEFIINDDIVLKYAIDEDNENNDE
jgi:hypothetical protein